MDSCIKSFLENLCWPKVVHIITDKIFFLLKVDIMEIKNRFTSSISVKSIYNFSDQLPLRSFEFVCKQKQPLEVFYKKVVLKNFEKFTGKHLCRPATLLKKRLWQWCFPVNFANFFKNTFLQNTSGWLPLYKHKCSGYSTIQRCFQNPVKHLR